MVRSTCLVASALLLAIPGGSVDDLISNMGAMDRQVQQHGPSSLSTSQRAAIYALGLSMSLLGYWLYPEVAREHHLLMVRNPKDTVWLSDFPMRSKMVRGRLEAFVRSLSRLAPVQDRMELSPARLSLLRGRESDRVYLALNPVTVSAVAQRAENDWVVSATATVPVEYLPNSGAITLASFGGRKLIVYERLFWALQHVGWYHPYVGVYRWQFTASSILNELSNANADRQ